MPSRVAWSASQLALALDADQKRRRKRTVPALERSTHIAVADLLRKTQKQGWFWTHLPSGELRTEATGRLLKRMGLRRGLPDFMLISPKGQLHFLELKRGKAPLNIDQLLFQEMCETVFSPPVPHAVARSFAEAEAQLRAWNVLRPEARA